MQQQSSTPTAAVTPYLPPPTAVKPSYATATSPDTTRQHRGGRKHGNADGLSRRPDPDSSDGCIDECIDGSAQEEATVLVRESPSQAEKSPDALPDSDGVTSCAWTDLAKWQTCDAGTQASEREFSYPEAMDDSPDSDQTEVKTLEQPVPDNIKRLWNRWDQLEVSNGLLYRRYISNSRKEEYLQLLIPRRCVENVLYNTHTGRTGGHYGSAKTLYQAKRRFHWNTWRSDTVRCCRRCPECCEYCYGTLRYVRPICRVTDMI